MDIVRIRVDSVNRERWRDSISWYYGHFPQGHHEIVYIHPNGDDRGDVVIDNWGGGSGIDKELIVGGGGRVAYYYEFIDSAAATEFALRFGN